MRQIVNTIYNFNELSEQAQDKAYFDWLSDNLAYPWDTENRNTLERFEEIFPIEVTDYQYGGYGHNYVRYDFNAEEEVADLRGIRLLKYLYNNYWEDVTSKKFYFIGTAIGKDTGSRHSNFQREKWNCPLTGYYIDNAILKPIWEFMEKPNDYITFEDLLESCLDEWIKACGEDHDNCTSKEYFEELSNDNGYEFYEDGKIA